MVAEMEAGVQAEMEAEVGAEGKAVGEEDCASTNPQTPQQSAMIASAFRITHMTLLICWHQLGRMTLAWTITSLNPQTLYIKQF